MTGNFLRRTPVSPVQARYDEDLEYSGQPRRNLKGGCTGQFRPHLWVGADLLGG